MDFKKELAELKSALETTLAEKAKAEVSEQLKSIQEKLNELEAKAKDADDDKIKALTEELNGLKAEAAANTKGLEILSVRVKATKEEPVKSMTYADAVVKALDDNHDNIQKFIKGENKKLSMEIKAVADQSTANVTGGDVYGAIYKPGIVPMANQIGHIRQSMNVITAGPGTDYYFMRESGGEGAPAPTAEKKAAAATDQATGLKPQFDIDLVESSVPFETIAGFMVVSRKALNNIPAFQSFLYNRLPEKLMDVEDAQILYGTGTPPALKGILTAGNYTAATSTATEFADILIDGLSQLEDTNKRQASAIWVRPADYWNLMKAKSTGATEFYNLPQNIVFVNGVLYVSGIPVFKTTALNAGDYVIAAQGGADLLVQEGMMLEMFNQDGTNVRTNQVTVRIEETIALPVYGSSFFVYGNNIS